MLLAAAAVAGLLAGVMRLSDAARSFVSRRHPRAAHPADHLPHVRRDARRGHGARRTNSSSEYLATLRTEAGRLTHLVENVLAYARLERGRADGRPGTQSARRARSSRPQPRLADRAAQAGMELARRGRTTRPPARASAPMPRPSSRSSSTWSTTPASTPRRPPTSGSTWRLRQRQRRAEFVCGTTGRACAGPPRRLFRPFSKSAREAAHSAPGVGLGLALEPASGPRHGRRPAAGRGRPGGHCFLLMLPAADS